MLSDVGKWHLPSSPVSGTGQRNPTSALQEVLSQTVGPADVHLLRFLRLAPQERIWQCQNDDETLRPPPGGGWIDREELDGLDLADPTIRPLLETWFAEFGMPSPPGRAPWECQGWWDGPRRWIGEQVGTGDVVVDRRQGGKVCSPWSYAVRLIGPGGPLFFKAVRDWSPHETRMTCALADSFPAHLPSLAAVDHARGWMLMEDFGGHLRERGEPPEVLIEACRQYCRFQIEGAGHVDDLARQGCPDLRGLEGESLEELFDGARRVLEEGESPAASVARERTAAALAKARELIGRMQDLGIPHSTVHGDFGWINIGRRRRSGHYVFFDWGSGCLWHPLVDLAKLVDLLESPSEAFLRSCVEPWTAVCAMDRLLESLKLGRELARVHAVWEYVRIHRHAEAWLAERVAGWLTKCVTDLGGLT
jgi:hypothetical protein